MVPPDDRTSQLEVQRPWFEPIQRAFIVVFTVSVVVLGYLLLWALTPFERVSKKTANARNARREVRLSRPPAASFLRVQPILHRAFLPESQSVMTTFPNLRRPDGLGLTWSIELLLEEWYHVARSRRTEMNDNLRRFGANLSLVVLIVFTGLFLSLILEGRQTAALLLILSYTIFFIASRFCVAWLCEQDKRQFNVLDRRRVGLTELGGCGGLPAVVALALDEPFGILFESNPVTIDNQTLRTFIGWETWWAGLALTPTEADVLVRLAGEFEATLDDLVVTARAISR
jgi:hypothetical protein